MSKETLLQLVEALREAGQRTHLEEEAWGHGACLSKFGRPCDCGVAELNTRVDAAAKALVAEIENEAAKVEELLRGIDRTLMTLAGGKK